MWGMENGPHIIQFREEAWIDRSEYVKYQRPNVHKLLLRDIKTGVWCTESATRIITSIFFFSKVKNSHEYVTLISTKFSEDVFDYKSTYV